MIKVAGIWEQGWNTPFLEFDLWVYPLRDFEVDEFYMTPITGIQKKVNEKATIEEVIAENKDLDVVWIDEAGETLLSEFKHPENALYIMGKTQKKPMVGLKKRGDFSVRIETKKDKSNNGMLWAHQAISIVLYDRLIKKLWP
jgi:hypothetical protein